MDNGDAPKRQGVTSTGKKALGFAPLQMAWGRISIDAVFRGGDKPVLRSIKNFGFGELPFKRLAPKAALRQAMPTASILFKAFTEGVSAPVLPGQGATPLPCPAYFSPLGGAGPASPQQAP